jgi:TolB protein
VADCWRIHPRRDEIAGWHLYVKHTKWSPDGRRLMFVFTNEIRYAPKYGELPRVKDVYVVNVDGTGLKRVCEFGHHPLWHPNDREILANSEFEGRPGLSFVLTDVETGEQRLAASCMAGTGHPSISPDGTRLVVEHVLPRQGYGSVNLVDLERDETEHLVQVRVTNHSHTGTHLHPAWSPDGRQILYASDVSGHAQLCVIQV